MKKEFSASFIWFLGDILYLDLINRSMEELIKIYEEHSRDYEKAAKQWAELIESTKDIFPEDYAFHKFLEENDIDDRHGGDVIACLIDSVYFVAQWKRKINAKNTDIFKH